MISSRDHLLKMLPAGLCVIIPGLIQIVSGTGKIEVHFKSYSDNCVEDFNTNACDPMFTFCLSSPQTRSRLSVNNCNYASTGESRDQFPNRNTIDLEHMTSIGGLQNPWVVEVRSFNEPTVMLVIRIRDADIIEHDHLEMLGILLNETIWPSKEQSNWLERTVSQDSYTMVFKVRMYCDPFYFTQKCDSLCRSDDSDSGHFVCDPNRGSKICLPGWQGEQCIEDIDECALGKCVFGECLNLPGDYSCSCYTNYTGSNCAELLNPCNPNPCQNGGICVAHSFEYSYFCNCTREWEGDICDIMNPCALEPCLNNGSCANSPNGTEYNCTCVYPYNGSNCETMEPTLSSVDLTGFQTRSTTTEMSFSTTTVDKIEITTSSKSKQIGITTTNESKQIEITTTNESQSPVTNEQQIQQQDDDHFQLWYIALIVAALIAVIVAVVILFIRRRRQLKAELNTSTPDSAVVSFNGYNLTFENREYTDMNRNNSESERQTRQLPAVPSLPTTPTDDELFNPQKPLYATDELGATGGSPNDYSDPKKSSESIDCKSTLHVRPVSERAQSNPYADFNSLADPQKEPGRPGNQKEESHYHDVLDIANSMKEVAEPDHRNERSDGSFNYDLPITPVVREMVSPYDYPPNNGSYYSTPPMRSSMPTQP